MNIKVKIFGPSFFIEYNAIKILVPAIDGPALITERHIKNYSYPLIKNKKLIIDDIEYPEYIPLICNVIEEKLETIVEICCKQ